MRLDICGQPAYPPFHVNELLRRVKLLAELLHLLVVAETLFIVLVQLQTLSYMTAQQRSK